MRECLGFLLNCRRKSWALPKFERVRKFIGFTDSRARADHSLEELFPSVRSEMTSRRVPVPNPKFARSSSDDEKDDDDDTRAAKSSSNVPTSTKGVLKQQAKMKDTKRASKKTSVEALVVATTTKKKDAEKKKKEDDDAALVQPSKILIPQNGDEGPKKWRLADQRRCALNVITRTNAFESSSSREVEGRIKRRASIENLPFWSSTERCRRDWKSRRKALLTLEDRRWFRVRPVARFSLSLSFQLKLTHLPHFLSLQILRIKKTRASRNAERFCLERKRCSASSDSGTCEALGWVYRTDKGFNFYWS